jgi:hypothetical protein
MATLREKIITKQVKVGVLVSVAVLGLSFLVSVERLPETTPPDGGPAATLLSQQPAPQPGFLAYSGYPMPNPCDQGVVNEPTNPYPYIQNLFCSPQAHSSSALLGVFSANPTGTLEGRTVALRGTRGSSSWVVHLWTRTVCVGKSCTNHYWGGCTSAQAGQTKAVSGGTATCEPLVPDKYGPLTLATRPYAYTTQDYGPSVMVPPGSSVTLQWSCQPQQASSIQYRWCEKNWFGSCYNIVHTTYSHTNFFSTKAVGTNFSTGNALTGTVTVNPATTTTYSMRCGGYRHFVQVADFSHCDGGVTSCTVTDNYIAGRTDANNYHGTTSITVLVGYPAPTVTTNPPSVVGAAATLSGSANPNGATTTGWFRYSTINPGTCSDSFGTRVPASGGTSLGSGSAAVGYTQPVSGLTPGVTYYYCAIAQNSGGTGFGAVYLFSADLCTDIPGSQTDLPSGCQMPNPAPGACIPPGYEWDGAQCVLGEPEIEAFYAAPSRVRTGASATLHWNITNLPEACSIAGDNGFAASVAEPVGSVQTNPILQRTQFTLTCGNITRSLVITIIPQYQEI